MCLASEAEKMEARSSQPSEDSSVCAQHSPSSTVDPDSKEHRDGPHLPLPMPPPSSTSSSASTSGSTSSSPTDATPSEISPSKTPKKKKKKKENKETDESGKNPTSPKKVKKRQSPDSDLDSVMFTIEAVAKGAWGSEETPKKKSRPSESDSSPGVDQSVTVKKKSKPKQKKAKDEVNEEEKTEEDMQKDVEMKTEEPPLSPKPECEEMPDVKVEPPSGVEEIMPHCSPAQPIEREEIETDANPSPYQTRPEDKEPEFKPETSGSRKSERSCKGALYKTLVSEGMLTSLRANVDRGITHFHISQRNTFCKNNT